MIKKEIQKDSDLYNLIICKPFKMHKNIMENNYNQEILSLKNHYLKSHNPINLKIL